ncbi:hypothetical protein Bca52824_042600 [Brassica carinata]|uniref:Uncharacterized protein n=1 Tax=Brassica carinata TaxID=52824 RepID=A0A8X7RXK0_BRACI|nr:hypothetical protein Bca52824_042600 [Brassica carinata]
MMKIPRSTVSGIANDLKEESSLGSSLLLFLSSDFALLYEHHTKIDRLAFEIPRSTVSGIANASKEESSLGDRKGLMIPKFTSALYTHAISSFVMVPIQHHKAGSLVSRAWISTGSLTGQPYFTKVDRILRLLLRSVSQLFEDSFADPTVPYGGEAIHCLSIKLGIESHLHRNLITLYGSEMNAETRRRNMLKVIHIIKKGMFYRSLTAMLHAFAYTSPKEALSVFGLVVKLGTPHASNISPLLVAFKHHQTGAPWVGASMFMLMEHYQIPLVPRLFGGIVEIYVAKGFLVHALDIIKANLNNVDNICITAFLDGCIRHDQDMEPALGLVEYLERQNFQYKINVSLIRRLKLCGLQVEFGSNVVIEQKEVGASWIGSMELGGLQH